MRDFDEEQADIDAALAANLDPSGGVDADLVHENIRLQVVADAAREVVALHREASAANWQGPRDWDTELNGIALPRLSAALAAISGEGEK